MNIEEWLVSMYGLSQDAPPGIYAPTSPPSSLTMMNEGNWTNDPTSHTTFDNGGQYINHVSPPPYTSTPVDIDPVNSKIRPNTDAMIDPALDASVFPNTPPTGYCSVMVPSHLAEATGKILIYLTQILEIPETPQTMEMDTEEPSDEPMFTEQELEQEIADLESIPESDHDPTLPLTIGDIRVTANPRPREIVELIDSKRAGPHRRTFYLARTKTDNYYWFSSPRSERSSRINKLVGDYCYKVRNGRRNSRKVQGGERRLRSGRVIRK
jgi:hypothetical protein